MAAGNPVCRVPNSARKEAADQSIPRPAVPHLNAALPSTTAASVSQSDSHARALFPAESRWPADGADEPSCRSAAAADDKAFSTLRAALALYGHTLHRTHPADFPQAFYVEHFGAVRQLATLERVRAFLAQIGGAG